MPILLYDYNINLGGGETYPAVLYAPDRAYLFTHNVCILYYVRSYTSLCSVLRVYNVA